jgi:glycerol kinase
MIAALRRVSLPEALEIVGIHDEAVEFVPALAGKAAARWYEHKRGNCDGCGNGPER